MLSIQQMHYILVLSEELQFQRASERCFVTQPTLSMQVKKSEELLGHPIFDRSRNPIELTPFGSSLLPIIREVVNETNKIDNLLERMKGNYKEVIKIGVIPTIASYLVPDMFQKWQERIGHVQLMIEELKTEELILVLERKEIDLAILAGPYNDNRLRTIPMFKEEILAYMPSCNKNEISVEELTELHPWLLSRGNCLRTQMIQFCQLKEGQEIDAWNYEGGNLELLLKMVDMNGGYSLVPEYYHLNEIQRRQLKSISNGTKSVPAREIIALVPNRSLKWETIEKLIREIQFNYNRVSKSEMHVLNWNGK
ncbi:MAG: LysR family transcriptional regulator [Crocinitomicaceae bacterium]|nr:LysR family transcriptional regulator [Crocinitomicaceae bacterium]